MSGEALMNGVSALIEKAPRAPSPLPPLQGTVRRWPAAEEEVCPHQTWGPFAS